VHARVILTGTTSMHIGVDVDAIEPRSQTRTRTTRCVMVFVAINDAGKSTPVPSWSPVTDEDRWLAEYAQRLKPGRGDLDTELHAHSGNND